MEKWPDGVNRRAYGLEISGAANYTEVTFEAGTKRRILNDLRAHKTYTFKLSMDDDPASGSTEFKAFMAWYEETLHSGAETFEFIDFDNVSKTKEYFMASPPKATGQSPKEVSLSLEEA